MVPPTPPSRARWRVGVFVEFLADGYTDPIVDELVRAAEERQVDLLVFVAGLDATDHPHLSHNWPLVLASRATIDAAVVVSVGNGLTVQQIEDTFERLDPLPMCSVAVPWTRYPRVEVDNEVGLRLGLRHLIRDHGVRRIACVRGPAVSAEAMTRYRVYQDELTAHGLELDPALVADGMYVEAHGADAVRLWLDERQVTFDAVVCANDGMAYGVLGELERRGIRVPSEVAVLGFDDNEGARYCRPPLTTVRQPTRDQARMALAVVLAQLEGLPTSPVTTIGSELVVRRSCGCTASTYDSGSLPAGPPDAGGAGAEEIWAQAALGSLTRALGVRGTPADLLAQHFLATLAGGTTTPFLLELEDALDAAARRGYDVLDALPRIALVRSQTRRHVPGHEPRARLDELTQDAGARVAEIAVRFQANVRNRFESRFLDLTVTSHALSAVFTFPELQAALSAHLRRFQVPRCFVCLYEGAAIPPQTARLVVACDVHGGPALPPDGLRFPAREILPDLARNTEGHRAWLLCSLLRGEAVIPGYVLLPRGVPEAFIYDGLVAEIGAAVRRIDLVERLLRETQRREAAERERLEKEMRLANQIQMGILPRNPRCDLLEISAGTDPASEVGGDYYDVIPVADGCWIGIGDVAGHGLPAGLVMLMCQSVVSGLVRRHPAGSPAALLPAVNAVLFENVHERMGQTEFVTFSLLRYAADGRVAYAGAHEDILVCRAATGRVERFETTGVWLAALPDIAHACQDESLSLAVGDVLLLYTDGVTEAMSPDGELFGPDRLALALERYHDAPVDRIRDQLRAEARAWMKEQADDMTLVVVRRVR